MIAEMMRGGSDPKIGKLLMGVGDNEKPGRIVILNGVPRSGKSSLARAIQETVPGTWLNLGVDSMAAITPPALMPGIGLRPGGERPDLEPMVARLYAMLFSSIRLHAEAGFDVVSDLGLHDDYSAPLGILDWAVSTLSTLGVLFIGIDCSLDEIMRRRNADPRGGFYANGETVPAPVVRWQNAVHAGKTYDLQLDMGRLKPEEGARQVAELLDNPPAEPALTRRAAAKN